MSRKKPTTHEKRMATQRRLREKVRTREASLRSSKPEEDDGPPPMEAIEAYVEVYEWAAENPDAAADLACYVESDWAGPMAGIAHPDHFTFPEDEIRQVAWQFRAWHILNGFKYSLDWPTPISAMTEEEIIEQLRADGAAGKITLAD